MDEAAAAWRTAPEETSGRQEEDEETGARDGSFWNDGRIKRLREGQSRKLRRLGVIGSKHSQHFMKVKQIVLNDLLSHFAKAAASDGSQGHVESRIKRRRTLDNKLQNAALLLKKDDGDISNLVTAIKSSKFKITEDPKTDFNVAHGVSTLSCYDKIPREIRDENSIESRPDLTQKLKSKDIHCDSIFNNCVNHEPLPMNLIEQTVSLDIGANAQNQICSQTTFDPNSIVFSNRCREYCTNKITSELNKCLEKFIAELSRLQKNLYNRDNAKGRIRRRFYAGFKEIGSRLQLKKLKLIIMAPDLDKKKDDGELDDLTHQLIDSCKKREIPIFFGLSRRKLGYLTHGKGFVSCIGVANYEALEDKLEEVLKKVLEAKNEFKILRGESDKIIDAKKVLTDDLLLSERVKVLLKTLTLA